jgi:hypothetical protein
MKTEELTTAELEMIVTSLIVRIAHEKRMEYEPTYTSSDGWIYNNHIPQSQWEKGQRAYIKRLTTFRKKIYEDYQKKLIASAKKA